MKVLERTWWYRVAAFTLWACALGLVGCGGQGSGSGSLSNGGASPVISSPPPPKPPAQLHFLAGVAHTAGQPPQPDAQLNIPKGVAIASDGTVYVSNFGNGVVQRFDRSGQATVIAMGLHGPAGLVLDSARNTLYVADSVRNAILQIALDTNTMSVLAGPDVIAGDWSAGSTDGPALQARFNQPWDLALHDTTLYINDLGNGRTRALNLANGQVSTLMDRNDPTAPQPFRNTWGVAVDDATGDVYVAENTTFLKLTPSGALTTLFTVVDGEPYVYDFVVRNGYLYWTEYANSRVMRLPLNNPLAAQVVAGTGVPGYVDGAATSAAFRHPTGISFDDQGILFIADELNYAVRTINLQSNTVSTALGPSPDSGVANGTGEAARFSGPQSTATDADGNVLVADTNNHILRKITPDTGVASTLAGMPHTAGTVDNVTATSAQFDHPRGIVVDGLGNLFVVDGNNCAIRKISSNGMVSTYAGQVGACDYADDTGNAARFDQPSGIAIDAQGNLYVADTGNYAVRKIDRAGAVTTLDRNTHFNPYGIAVDKAGKVYIADKLQHTIRVIDPGQNHAARVLTGTAQTAGYANGSIDQATFNAPSSIAVDGAGNLFVADSGNAAVRRITPAGQVSTWVGANPRTANTTLGVLPASLDAALSVGVGGNRLTITSPTAVFWTELP